MPASVPGVTFDRNGICNFCHDFQEITYRGKAALDKIIDSIKNKGGTYDCIVPMSGGRDSTYALYVARKTYNLRTLAVNYDNEFRHDQALYNMQAACQKLDTHFITIRSSKNISRNLARATLREEMSLGNVKLPNVCKACSYGIKSIPYRLAEQYNIPLIIYAGSQEEKCEAMINQVMRAVPIPFKRRIFGKLNRLTPFYWRVRYYEIQLKREFPVMGNSVVTRRIRPILQNTNITEIHLFDYIPWDRKAITETITNELGWKRTPGHMSSWRNDCALHQFINYDFIARFGCSRDCFGYCRMINAGKMSREEALRQEEAMLCSFEKGVINGVAIEKFLIDELGLRRNECDKIQKRSVMEQHENRCAQ